MDMIAAAERGGYAVGYFECWSLESLLAAAAAAERLRSPVILGYSGIQAASPLRCAADPAAVLAAMGRELIRTLSVPACLLFNESPDYQAVVQAVRLGFGLVMYTDETLDAAVLAERTSTIVTLAHEAGAAVEGELRPLEGVGGELDDEPADGRLTDPRGAGVRGANGRRCLGRERRAGPLAREKDRTTRRRPDRPAQKDRAGPARAPWSQFDRSGRPPRCDRARRSQNQRRQYTEADVFQEPPPGLSRGRRELQSLRRHRLRSRRRRSRRRTIGSPRDY